MWGDKGTLVAWGGGVLWVTLGGLDLGAGSGLDSSVSAATAGWTCDLAVGKGLTQCLQKFQLLEIPHSVVDRGDSIIETPHFFCHIK